MQTRRGFLSTLVTILAASSVKALPFPSGVHTILNEAAARLEAQSGGRLGLAILESGSGMIHTWRGDERFLMASTFKALLAGAILRRVDQGQEDLGRAVAVRAEDLVEYAPAVEPMVGCSMTVAALCEATLTLSDNAAANILLNSLGGPAGLTTILQELGDEVSRLDRYEPGLNDGAPGDLRDTTTPQAFLDTMTRLLVSDALSPTSREQLLSWLVANQTGDDRIRAGVPEGWVVGDKTGTSGQGDVHDVAILLPPNGAPLLVVVFLSGTSRPVAELNPIHAEVGAIVASLIS